MINLILGARCSGKSTKLYKTLSNVILNATSPIEALFMDRDINRYTSGLLTDYLKKEIPEIKTVCKDWKCQIIFNGNTHTIYLYDYFLNRDMRGMELNNVEYAFIDNFDLLPSEKRLTSWRTLERLPKSSNIYFTSGNRLQPWSLRIIADSLERPEEFNIERLKPTFLNPADIDDYIARFPGAAEALSDHVYIKYNGEKI